MSRPHVIFATVNRRFFPYAVLFLKSLSRTYADHPDVHLYHPDLSSRQCRYLTKFKNVKPVFCPFDEFKIGPAMASHHAKFADPRISYARFLIWTDRFKDYETVVHLDTDIIVRGSLDALFVTDRFLIFPETYTGKDAVFYAPEDPGLKQKLKEDGIPMPWSAANAGVFAVPRHLRTAENYAFLMKLIDRYTENVKWSDQSILNLWMAKRGITVTNDFRFNYQQRLLRSPIARDVSSARIFHLNGVDLAYRYFLMKAAHRLHVVPGGWRLYLSLERSCHMVCGLWRRRSQAFIF